MVRAESTVDSLSDLPFLVFVGIADASQAVGAAEADAFFRLLEKREWAQCPELAAALPEAARKYPDHWRRYLAGAINASVPSVMHAVKALGVKLSSEHVALLETDLMHITDVLRKAAKKPKLFLEDTSIPLFGALELALRASAPEAKPSVSAAGAEPSGAPAPVPAADWQAAIVARAEPWDSVHTRLRCVRIADETPEVRSFWFASDQPRPFSYKPGQFVTLELDIAGKKVRRNYTIASSPSRPDLISLTIKRVPGGAVSNWLHDQLKVGDVLPAVVANGKFNCWDIQANKILLLSAGIGITPVMSMARWQADLCLERDTVFFHITRTPSAIVFRRELEQLQGPHFKLILNCTRPAPDEEWSGLRGRLDAEAVKKAVPDYLDRIVFMCGPEPWMKAMRELFTEAGLPAANIHQEYFGPRSWSTTGEPAPAAAVAPSAAGRAKVVFTRSRKEVECSTDETLLEVAERSGIEIPSSCRVGACGTCKALKTSGEVKQSFCPGLSDSEAAQGYVLTCSSTAEGTVELDA